MGPPSNGGGISIPTGDAPMSNGAPGDDRAWSSGPRSPSRGQGDHPPRRSSRSRSPTRGDDRGYVSSPFCFQWFTDRLCSRANDGSNNPGNNLHVSGLSSRVDTRDLEQAFAKIGRVRRSLLCSYTDVSCFEQVKKAQVMYDPHTRESRGFGFVTMETGEEADAAITALHGTDLMGKTLTVTKVSSNLHEKTSVP